MLFADLGHVYRSVSNNTLIIQPDFIAEIIICLLSSGQHTGIST